VRAVTTLRARLLFAAFALAVALSSCHRATGPVAVIHVRGFGDIRFELLPAVAPHHVANFIALATTHFYDGTTFHRVIPQFMIQGGDPLSKDADPANDGTGGPGYFLQPEFNATHHAPGIVSMARQARPATAGSQFFIMTTGSEAWQPQLDGQYTVFGRVLAGQDVVDTISKTPRDARDRPLGNVTIESVEILPEVK
jgi:peptidyl-prolyl cis-trans isomerase B (cyclophilin B)